MQYIRKADIKYSTSPKLSKKNFLLGMKVFWNVRGEVENYNFAFLI